MFKTVDIVVLSSHWEGFGLAAIEGMAAGKPVIASRVEGLSDIVGKYGLLFDRGNDAEFSKLIKKLLNDQDFYRGVSLRCAKRAEMYDINNMVWEILSTYKSLFNQ